MWNVLLKIVKDCANINCPLVKIKIPDDSPVWFTSERSEEITQKDYLYKEAK